MWPLIVGAIISLVIIGALIAIFKPNILGFGDAIEDASSCSSGLAAGVCMESCDEGFLAVPGRGCPYVCCVAQSEEAKDLKEQMITFSNAIIGLNQCASNRDNSYCNTAYRNIVKLIKEDRMKITFTKQGEETWARLLNSDDAVVREWEMYYEFTGPNSIWTLQDRAIMEIYYDDGRVEVASAGPNGALTGFQYLGGGRFRGKSKIEILHE